jgi:hypothetical protein
MAFDPRTALGGGPPAASGTYIVYGNNTNFLYDYAGFKWFIAAADEPNPSATMVDIGSGPYWTGNGGAALMTVDRFGKIWVWNSPNWWYWDYSGGAWAGATPVGPETQTGVQIAGGSQQLIVDASGNWFTGSHPNATNVGYWDIYENGAVPTGGGGLIPAGVLEYADSPLGGRTVWAFNSPNWYYYQYGSGWVTTGATPPNLHFPTTSLTVGSPAIGGTAMLGIPLDGVIPTLFGQRLSYGDTLHSLNVGGANPNIIQLDATGKIYRCIQLSSATSQLLGLTLSAGGFIEYAPTTGVSSNVWAFQGGVWYYLRGVDSTFYAWNAGPNPQATNGPVLTFPTATGITVSIPGQVNFPNGPNAFCAAPLGNLVFSVNGMSLYKGDTQHCLMHVTAPGVQLWIDASGTVFYYGQPTSGIPALGTGDFVEISPVAGLGSNFWAHVGTTWYYLYGAAFAWYVWNTGPFPQATNGPVLTFPTATGIIVGSPGIVNPGGPKALLAQPIGNVIGQTPYGQWLLYGDTAHSILGGGSNGLQFDASGKVWFGGLPTFGPSFSAGDLIECAVTGNSIGSLIWARISGVWYYFRGSDQTFYAWNAGPNPQATSAPVLTFPAATGITATASPAFTAPTLKVISNLAVPPLAVGSPAFTVPVLAIVITNIAAPPSLAVSSPAFTMPTGGYNFAQFAFAVGSPAIAVPGFIQNYKFAAAAPLTVGSPAFGSSVWGVVFAAPPALAVASPAIGSPALVRVVAVAASSLAIGSPALTAPIGGNNFSAVELDGISPVFDTPDFNQSATLVAAFSFSSVLVIGKPVAYRWAPLTLAPASPAFSAPFITQTQNLSIPNWTIAGPDINGTAPNMSGATAIGAVGLTPNAIAFPAVGLSQRHGLVAVVPSVAIPALDVPVVGVVVGGAANPLVTGPPSIDVPSLVRVVALPSALNLWDSSPSIGVPSVSMTAAGAPISLAVQPLEFGAPAVTPFDNLAAGSFAPDAPDLEAPDLGVIVRASATGIVLGSPAIGKPLVGSIAAGAPVPLTVAAPTVGTPSLGLLAVPLDASPGLSVAPPLLGTPAAAGKALLGAPFLSLGRPAIGSPRAGATASGAAADLASGSPVIGAPQIIEVVALDAADLIIDPPAFERLWLDPTLHERNRFGALGYATARLEIGLASIGQIYPLVARGVTVKSPDQYWAELPAPLSLSLGSPILGTPQVLQLTIRPAPVKITGQVSRPGIIGIDDPVSEMKSSSDATAEVSGRPTGKTKVSGQRASAKIIGVGEFTKIKF